MPLVDAPTIQLDESLTQGIANTFSTSRGLIFDKSGHPWCIWHVGQLQHWWRLYGEKVDSPMGRELANAAVEQESWQLNQTNFASIKGIFRSKNNKNGWKNDGILSDGVSQISKIQVSKINSFLP